MIKNLFASLVFLLFVSEISAQESHVLLKSERALIPAYMASRAAESAVANIVPPISPVRTIAEWEELQALVIGWKTYPTILRQIVAAAKSQTRVIIVYTSPDSETSLINYLSAGGVDTVNVTFLPAALNSVWARDYGPWSAYTNDVDTLITIDWIYNRPRPQDDAVPVVVSNFIGTPLYQTTTAPWNLVHTGGNFMTDGFGTGFSSNLVLNDNMTSGGFGVNHTSAEVDTIMNRFMGINRYIRMNTLPYDVIHHIDMHIKLLDEQTLLVGEYPQGISDGPQIEANLQYILNNYNSVYGTPYKVIRIPMPDNNNLYPSTGGDYFTYTNSSFINKTIIVPVYGIPEDSIAISIYKESLPGYSVVPINCTSIIGALGALHCITKEIGTDDPLLISHQALPNTTDTLNSYTVSARIQHRSGIATATIYWRTDTLQPWQAVTMNSSGITNYWNGFIPAQPAGSRIYYYIGATAMSGKNQVRPLPAPNGYWYFDVTGTTALSENNYDDRILDIFPNPCKGITCIPIMHKGSGNAEVFLTDVSGRRIEVIHRGPLQQGDHKLFIDAKNLSDGVYFISLRTEKASVTRKFIVHH